MLIYTIKLSSAVTVGGACDGMNLGRDGDTANAKRNPKLYAASVHFIFSGICRADVVCVLQNPPLQGVLREEPSL